MNWLLVRGLMVIIFRGDDFKLEDIDLDNLEPMKIELEPLPTADNTDYQFQHPGTPEINQTTNYCSHCHVTINNGWYSSVHQTSASIQNYGSL